MITVPIVFTPIIIIEMSLGTGRTAQWLRAAFSEHLGLIPSPHDGLQLLVIIITRHRGFIPLSGLHGRCVAHEVHRHACIHIKRNPRK